MNYRYDQDDGRKGFNPIDDHRHAAIPAHTFNVHATLCLNTTETFSSDSVVIPSRETILMSGKILALRSTPPVEVSASAAVSSARSAIAIASSSFSSFSFLPPQLFS